MFCSLNFGTVDTTDVEPLRSGSLIGLGGDNCIECEGVIYIYS